MGINANVLRLLLHARQSGVSFSHTATIGRQGIHIPPDLCRRILCEEFSAGLTDAEIDEALRQPFCERLLEALGAENVSSYVLSDFEGATFAHDFNLPVDEVHHENYSLVIDGGSLEHIFNFPVAVKNCMEMTRRGGHFIGVSPGNNYVGHGFYQFSPELFYRVFSEENGFEVREMFWVEGRAKPIWYRIPDAKHLGRRITARNDVPTFIMFIAQRVSDAPVFGLSPQQSDYSAIWKETKKDSRRPSEATQQSSRRPSVFERCWRRLLRQPAARSATYPDFAKVHIDELGGNGAVN